tara:strand:+ start:273 stop:917 length:645 start_codon:yes stop_codon:yes gene_type:complete
MQLVDGFYIPDGDKPLHHNAPSVVNHDSALADCTLKLLEQQNSKYRRMVDVGGNVGRWSRNFATHFKTITAFEPASYNIECFKKNCADFDNIELHEFGLYDSKIKGKLEVVVPEHLGSTRVVPDSDGPITLNTLDEFNYDDIDVLKIDVEGAELNVMNGAKNTINHCSPIIVIERCFFNQGSQGKQATDQWLRDFGYTRKFKITRDCIYVRDDH